MAIAVVIVTVAAMMIMFLLIVIAVVVVIALAQLAQIRVIIVVVVTMALPDIFAMKTMVTAAVSSVLIVFTMTDFARRQMNIRMITEGLSCRFINTANRHDDYRNNKNGKII